jgi:ATP-dependent DNA ligase
MSGYVLPVETEPMEAKVAADLPAGEGWQFEPKWDGFRCLAYKSGGRAELRAKSGKSLSRYFPEMLHALQTARADDFVVDGELAIPVGDSLSFSALQDRLHPAESRVLKLAQQTPALLILFDCLADGPGSLLMQAPLLERRAALERVAAALGPAHRVRLTPYTRDRAEAVRWLAATHGALDGVVAKRLDEGYAAGKRAMIKVKRMRTADCVVGGFRYAAGSKMVGSLLLGLFNERGLLDHVGFTSAISEAARPALTRRVEALRGGVGFTGDAPGGPSRWSDERSTAWERLRPELVAEVRYDHATDGRFRHGTMFLRWRPDKAPEQCTREQMQEEARPGKLIEGILK